MIEGLRAFPRAMTKQERKHPRLTKLHDRVAGRTAAPRISRPNGACRSIKQVFTTILSWMISREAKARKAMLRIESNQEMCDLSRPDLIAFAIDQCYTQRL